MYRFRHLRRQLRAISSISLIIAFVTGISFAALQSQDATISGSTITSATAGLGLSTVSDGSFTTSLPGFHFTNVEPGGDPTPNPGYDLFFKNTGTAALKVVLKVNKNQLANPSNLDLSKVWLFMTPTNGSAMQQFTLAALGDSFDSGGTDLGLTLQPGQTVGYKLQVSMNADVVNNVSSSVGLTNINFIFSGSSVHAG